MRSFLSFALLASSALAAPGYGADPECETKGATVYEYYDVTVTEVVYYTPEAKAAYTTTPCTTTRKKHHHKPKPTNYVVTYVPEPQPVYTPQPQPKPKPQPAPPQNYGSKPPVTGDMKTDVLAYHNYWRQRHGAGPLSWNDDLANYAAGNTGGCVMQHTGGPYGENLAFGTSLGGYEGALMWYDEGSMYSQGEDFSEDTGHYTQVIWKGSQEIGCYLQDCGGNNYLMCEYQPAGNVIGAFSENCGPLDVNDPNEYSG